MALDLQKGFEQYFNVFLRNYLKYPETFTVIIGDNTITLIPNQTSQLIQIIKSDPLVKERLISEVTKFLKKYRPEVYDVFFYSHGSDIIIKYDTIARMSESAGQSLDTYASIIAQLPTAEDINVWCRSNKEFEKVCRIPRFWAALIKTRFPDYYKELRGGYNWEQVYKGLLWYTSHSINIEHKNNIYYNSWIQFIGQYPEVVRYLILNDIIIINGTIVYVIMGYSTDIQIIKKLLDKGYIEERHQLKLGFNNAVKHNNTELVKLYLDYKDDSTELTKKSIESLISGGLLEETDLSIEIFQLIVDHFYKDDNSIKFLGNISDYNTKLIDYIIDNNPIDDQDILTYIVDIIEIGKENIFKKLYDKYESKLSEQNMRDIKEMAENLYIETGDTGILDILGIEPPEDF